MSDPFEKPTAIVQLKKGREKPLANGHPWLFSGAIAAVSVGDTAAGDIVEVQSSAGHWLARGFFNPLSQIRCRVLTREVEEQIGYDFWYMRLSKAIAAREHFGIEEDTDAFRLVNAESDGIPGLIVDRYGDFLVLQCLVSGIDRRKRFFAEALMELTGAAGVLERSDVSVRELEGLAPVVGLLAGQTPPERLTISEAGRAIVVDLYHGHKTGYYLDQRENRKVVCSTGFMKNRSVLNCFSYTGGFSVFAAANGANKVTNIDESESALTLADVNMQINGLGAVECENIKGDAFKVLRMFRDTGRAFDAIILDPPKFAHTKAQVQAACRGYKDLNWLAIRLLKPGGLLATFSCSGLVSEDLFQKVLFSAALDAGRQVQIIRRLSQAADHPVLVSFPEAAYLKGFFCYVS